MIEFKLGDTMKKNSVNVVLLISVLLIMSNILCYANDSLSIPVWSKDVAIETFSQINNKVELNLKLLILKTIPRKQYLRKLRRI